MKNLRWKLTNSLLGVALLTGATMNLALRPGGEQGSVAPPSSVSDQVGVEPCADRSSQTREVASSAAAVSPVWIAEALGWASPVPRDNFPESPPPPDPPSTVQPVERSWIRYVGAINDADGLDCRYFKDERSGRIIRAAFGRRIEGWLLIECGDGFCLLDDGDIRLRVRMAK